MQPPADSGTIIAASLPGGWPSFKRIMSMTLHADVRKVLELAEQCTLEADVPTELKEAVRYCILSEWVWIQPVQFLAIIQQESTMVRGPPIRG